MNEIVFVFLRERREKAITEAQQPDVQLLTDAELLTLHAATQFNQLLQQQRYNLIVFGFCTGLRPSTRELLKCNMLRVRHDEDGQTLMEVVIGDMKNLAPHVDKLVAGLHKLQVLQHPDPRCFTFTCKQVFFDDMCQSMRSQRTPTTGCLSWQTISDTSADTDFSLSFSSSLK